MQLTITARGWSRGTANAIKRLKLVAQSADRKEITVDFRKERSAADQEGPMQALEGAAGTLLLVTDSTRERAPLTDILTPEFRCQFAIGAEATLAIALVHRSDLILLDQAVGISLAAELCQRIRADSRLRDIPVLRVTSSSGPEALLLPTPEGVDDYLFTPLRRPEVLARVRSLVQLRRARLEGERLTAVRVAASRLPHDVNNPLAFVSGGLEQLCESLRNLLNSPSGRLAGNAPELLAELDQIQREVRSGVQRIRAVAQNMALLADSGQGPLI
jgi:DNA-binding response OmpR family regulator